MYSDSLQRGVIPRKKIKGELLGDSSIRQLQFDMVILTNISFKGFLYYCYEKPKVRVFKTGLQADKVWVFLFVCFWKLLIKTEVSLLE